MGGMAIRNMGTVALTAFACSWAASLKHMAVIFPERIALGPQGDFLQFSQQTSSEIGAQVLRSVGEYRRLVPQGRFKENDDFSAILKAIVELEDGCQGKIIGCFNVHETYTEEAPLRFMGQDVLYHQPLSLD